ncbi:hypothetical protein IKD82_01830 [Candidatus Saccharibacteria bacterium]|nr:hypothetical protein [Candidatus Saccharibacteria bacterium]
MKDNTELIINHDNNESNSNEEITIAVGEDISNSQLNNPVSNNDYSLEVSSDTDIDTFSNTVSNNNTETQNDADEYAEKKDELSPPENNQNNDESQNINYPLPTPEVSKMDPPIPPTIEK